MDLLSLSDWEIPWAAIGGFLLGLGSTLSGIAAVITSKRAVRELQNESHPEDGDSNNLRVVDGSGERLSDSGSD